MRQQLLLHVIGVDSYSRWTPEARSAMGFADYPQSFAVVVDALLRRQKDPGMDYVTALQKAIVRLGDPGDADETEA